MPTDNTGLSRRKLLRTTAIGVPAAGLLAFGSTLVTATSANAVEVDGWWGSETSAGLQRLMNAVIPEAQLTVDGVISGQNAGMAPYCPGIVGGWEWVPDDQPHAGSPTIECMRCWLRKVTYFPSGVGETLSFNEIDALQDHYKLPRTRRLEGGSSEIRNLQSEINLWVG